MQDKVEEWWVSPGKPILFLDSVGDEIANPFYIKPISINAQERYQSLINLKMKFSHSLIPFKGKESKRE
jgi:hypothetical protein